MDFTPETRTLVVSQENVLGDPDEPWVGPNQVIRVLARAFHAVAGTRPVDPTGTSGDGPCSSTSCASSDSTSDLTRRLHAAVSSRAMQAGKWKGTAAAHDRQEYWATGVLAYFDALGQAATPPGAAHPVVTRESLKSLRSRSLHYWSTRPWPTMGTSTGGSNPRGR